MASRFDHAQPLARLTQTHGVRNNQRLTARPSGPLGLSRAEGFREIALGKGPRAVPNGRDVKTN